jgi:predicted ATPase/Flp pilus assembly protein TadD
VHHATSFVGREAELERLDAAASEADGVVVVTGAPGVGKSRLVAHWASARPDGASVARADLGAARDLEDALRRVGRALALTFGPDDDLDRVVDRIGQVLKSREPAVLWLDDADVVIEALAKPLARWRDQAVDLLAVVTSRRGAIDVPHSVVSLSPLPHAHAVALLIDRARAVRPDFVATDAQRPSIEAIARTLDALPLAIELVAPRLRLLSPAQLLARLEQLEGRDALRLAIERSLELLQPWERDALAQCSVFRDGFYLAAAEQVIDLSAHSAAPDVLTVLEALVSHSLLRTESATELPDEVRIRHLGAVRERAAAELAHGSEVHARHARYYLTSAEAWDDGIESADEAACTSRLVIELPNLEAAYERTHDPAPRVRLGLVLHMAYQRRGPFGRQAELVEHVRTLAHTIGDQRLVARTELAWARVHRWANDLAASNAALERAIDASVRANDVQTEASCARNLAANHFRAGDLAGFERHLTRALDAASRSGRASDEVNARNGLGYLYTERGDTDRAEAELERALRLAQETRIPGLIALSHTSLSALMLRAGLADEVEHHSSAAIAAYESLGYLRQWALERIVRGQARVLLGRYEQAREDAEAGLERARWLGLDAPVTKALSLAGRVAFFERRFGDARDALEEAVARQDPDPRTWAYVGAARAALGHASGAREAFAKAGDDEVCVVLRRFIALATGEGPSLDPARTIEGKRIVELLSVLGPRVSDPDVRGVRLEVIDGDRGFRLESGVVVDLTRRRALRGVLHGLVEQHLTARGEPLSLDAVLEAGWPGERMSFESGARRVYVTINRLRKLGLGELVLTTGDGYMLEPRVDVVRVAAG